MPAAAGVRAGSSASLWTGSTLQPASAHRLPVPKEACDLEQPACTSSRTEMSVRKKTYVGGCDLIGMPTCRDAVQALFK